MLNQRNELISGWFELKDRKTTKDVEMIYGHIYDLAMLNHRPMEPEEMKQFVQRNNDLLIRLASDLSENRQEQISCRFYFQLCLKKDKKGDKVQII